MKADIKLLLMAFKAGYSDDGYENAFYNWLDEIGAEIHIEGVDG